MCIVNLWLDSFSLLSLQKNLLSLQRNELLLMQHNYFEEETSESGCGRRLQKLKCFWGMKRQSLFANSSATRARRHQVWKADSMLQKASWKQTWGHPSDRDLLLRQLSSHISHLHGFKKPLDKFLKEKHKIWRPRKYRSALLTILWWDSARQNVLEFKMTMNSGQHLHLPFHPAVELWNGFGWKDHLKII